MGSRKPRTARGFTIVELLVVIVVIAILAAITIVSYTGISGKANVASLQSDLDNSSKQLNLFQVENGAYPSTINCAIPNSTTNPTNLCIKSSGSNTYSYKAYSPNSFMQVSKNGNTCYSITNNSAPIENCVTIGTQTWMKYNLDVGDRIDGITNQTSNSIVEKYCYNNDPANCTTYGGLYQWNEMMQYGATDICPTGFRIPTDAEYKTLEMYLGMSQAQADATGWRGTDQGTQLKPSGTSGLNLPLAGNRTTDGSFGNLSSDAYLWSSSESSTSAWKRFLPSYYATVNRSTTDKGVGFSVRCLGN